MRADFKPTLAETLQLKNFFSLKVYFLQNASSFGIFGLFSGRLLAETQVLWSISPINALLRVSFGRVSNNSHFFLQKRPSDPCLGQ